MDNMSSENLNPLKPIIKLIECELKLAPDCLKTKNYINKKMFFGSACKPCRIVKKQIKTGKIVENVSSEKILELCKNELDIDKIAIRKKKSKEYYEKNRGKILEQQKKLRLRKQNKDIDKDIDKYIAKDIDKDTKK